LILNSNANIKSCAVWGGEDNDPPIYGKVFISLTPQAGQIITQNDKDKIQAEIIGPKAPVGLLAEFVNPSYVYIQLKVGVVYNPKITALTAGQIQSAVEVAINDYFATELNVLNKNFYLSKVHNYIKDSSPSIVSINLNPKMQIRHTMQRLGYPENFRLDYNNKLEPRTLHSTWFDTVISGGTYKVKLQDVPNAGVVPPEYSGTGKVYVQDTAGNNIAHIGTIDYDTGQLSILNLVVANYYADETFIRINVKTHDDVKDIKTQILSRISAQVTSTSGAVEAVPSRNSVLVLDDTASNSVVGSRKGLEINVTQYVEDDE